MSSKKGKRGRRGGKERKARLSICTLPNAATTRPEPAREGQTFYPSCPYPLCLSTSLVDCCPPCFCLDPGFARASCPCPDSSRPRRALVGRRTGRPPAGSRIGSGRLCRPFVEEKASEAWLWGEAKEEVWFKVWRGSFERELATFKALDDDSSARTNPTFPTSTIPCSNYTQLVRCAPLVYFRIWNQNLVN